MVVCPHWGKEYVLEQTENQENWAEIFIENGADLILGTHPHVIEPVELITSENGNQALVYYSLGNFVNWTSAVFSRLFSSCRPRQLTLLYTIRRNLQYPVSRQGIAEISQLNKFLCQ